MSAAYAKKCPRCESPDPNRHPAMQFEGEVQLCEYHWHWRTDAERAEREEWRRKGYWAEPASQGTP